MRVTREELAARTEARRTRERTAVAGARGVEAVLLAAASIVVLAALVLVYLAKAGEVRAEKVEALDLNAVTGAQQLIPLLAGLPSAGDREFVANRIFQTIRRGDRFGNIGALARVRVSEDDLRREASAAGLRERLEQARQRRDARERALEEERGWLGSRWARLIGADERRPVSVPLLTSAELAGLKPHLRVRGLSDFRRSLLLWGGLFLVAFFAVHMFWRVRGFTGDNILFPLVLLLAGTGLALMVALRDPIRDTLLFREFAEGAIAGCAAAALFSVPDYERRFGRLSFIPLALALLLALALGLFGSGPGGSDAKVNLFFFQPVEVIRILLVLFLAGYFAQNWDALRQLRQDKESLPPWARRFRVPRLDYLLPVLAGVAVSLALFFWLSDLGPALVIGALFLTLYSLARNQVVLALAGFGAIVLGFAAGYAVGYPQTVGDRVSMWLSPWDNGVRGGDQLAHSLWSLATGGVTGTGLGLGESQYMPAAHTDLILSVLGEQAGFLGVLAILALYALLVWRGIRIARDAAGVYSFFLAAGLTLITALEIALISGGLLGLVPLSGVVSPFLSYGRTSMVANFVVVAMLLAISSRPGTRHHATPFQTGTRVMMAVLAVAAVVIAGRFAWVQTLRADDTLVRGALTMQADGVRRYQYNPRLLAVARELPKGTIYDRSGLPLATGDWTLIEKHRAEYQKAGVRLDLTTNQRDSRHYPLGATFFYLLGDTRNRLKQGASNTAFQEAASRIRLQGYDDVAEVEQGRDEVTGQITARVRRDYRALIPLVRHRYEPEHPAVKELRERPRDVRMSVDACLQLRVTQILRAHLGKLNRQKGAAVVLDPETGDLLAAVSLPLPSEGQFASLKTAADTPLPSEDLLDRARFGLYPPGSSFKIVTAIAALRKDPGLGAKRFDCIRLPDGRVGNVLNRRAIRDDIKDTQPHGSVDMGRGITVSCNAYFAQLGSLSVGAEALFDTASKLGISVAAPNTAAELAKYLPQASYGQGEVVASPFQMARVAATIANGGNAVQGRWVVDETNPRVREPVALLPPSLANQIGGFMRQAVVAGTGRAVAGSPVAMAGKTGTAELAKAPSHAWFIGFAPYGAPPGGKQIAFAVLIENGQYGGTAAAPVAGEIVAAARQAGLI